MATEIDALQLNITASTSTAKKSIESLIGALTRLGDKFGVFDKTSNYSTNIGNMATSITSLSDAINGIDAAKFKELSSSIKSFVKASESLANFSGFNSIEKNANGVSVAVKKVADEFAKEWGISGKNATEQLTSAIERMYSGLEDGSFSSAANDVQNLVKEFANLTSVLGNVNSQWQEVRKWVSSSNIALPDMTGEWGDDYKHKRGVLGIGNTTTGTGRQGDFTNQIAEMNSALGTTFDVTKSEQDLLNDIVEYIERGRDSASGLSQEFWNIKENSRGLIESIHGLVGSLANIQDNAQNINNSFSNIQSSPLESITSGLESISGITLPDFSNLTVLASAISKIGGDNGTRAKENLIPIADGIKAFANVNIPQLDGIETFANGLRSLGSKNVNVAAEALPRLAQGLRDFATVQIPTSLSGITELGQSLSVFGRKTAQQAVDTIPKLTVAFRGLIAELASSPAVSNNIVQLTDALARFVTNVNRVCTSSTVASKGLNLFGNTASKVSKKSFSLAAAIGKIYASYFLLFRAFGKVKESIDIASDLKEVQNVVDTTFGDMTNKVEEFAQTSIEKFGMSELSAKQYASRFQAMGVAMAIPAQSVAKAQQQLNKINPTLATRGYSDTADSIADMSINIAKLTADMASFYNVAQKDVAKDLESIWTGQTRPLRQYGLDLTNATLQEWAMKNGIDANIKSMTQAEKTLLRYQYVLANTSAAQGDFSKTSLTWANQIRMLGQNFQRLGRVIGEGFIAWLRPMIVTINSYMDAIIAAVQRVVNALGQIFGWEMIVDTTGDSLIDDTEGVADAWDDATGAAKKYAKQLLGIDELNNLTTNDGGSGSGDSDLYGGLSGGNIIEPGGIEFKKIESDIKSLFQLGDKISDKLREMLQSIDWDSIYEKASLFGKGLASFLNGLIQPSTFKEIGKTIAGVLNIVVESALAFAQEGRWDQWGESLGESINGFFKEFKWADAGQAINKFVHGLWESLKKGVETIEWKDVFSSFWDFFSNIGIDTISLVVSAITIKNAAKWIFPKIQELSMKAALVIAVARISFEGGKKLGEFLNPEDKEIYATFKFSDFSDYDLKDYLSGLNLMIQDFKNNNALQFTAPVLFGPIGAWASFQADIEQIFNNLTTNGKTYLSAFVSWLNPNVFAPIGKFVLDLKTAIDNAFTEAWNHIVAIWQGASTWFNVTVVLPIKTTFTVFTTTVGTIFSDMWQGIKDGAKTAANAIIGFFEKAINGIIDSVNGFLKLFNSAASFAASLNGDSFTGIDLIQHVSIKGFENGGFPTQGSLFVAGETYGQSEWVGNVNGKTGVVSGYEITDISKTIRETSEAEIMLLRQQNQLLNGILSKEFGISQSALGQAVQSYGQQYFDRTGRQAYQY